MAGIVLAYIRLLRPQQWIKNLLLLFPPFFAGEIFNPAVVDKIFPALAAFACAASCGYIINDIRDFETDQNHAVKKDRAIASGRIPVRYAITLAVVLYFAAVILGLSIHGEFRRFQFFIILYLFNSFTYTFFLKYFVIIDVFLIAFGFLIRVLAGGEAFRMPVTNWLFLTVFSVSLLLAAGKRLGELISLGDGAQKHRKSLGEYSQSFLEGILWFSASAALVMYALYSLDHNNKLFYTVPLAAFGLLRYIFIVKQGNGDPTDALLKDGQVMGVGVVWLAMVGLILY